MNERSLRVAEWSALAGVGAAGFFNAFVPTPYEISHEVMRDGNIDQDVADLRQCYAKAALLSALLGVASSLIARSIVPGLVTGAAAGAMIASYESALPVEQRILGRPSVPILVESPRGGSYRWP